MDVQKFTAAVISIVVVVIIAVTVLIPILQTNMLPEGEGAMENAEAINAMLGVIPILVIVGIIIAVVGMFLYTRRN